MRVAEGGKLIVIVAGDEAGETGASLAQVFRSLGYAPSAMALILAGQRGQTVRDCARELAVPFSEVDVKQFDDPYHVTRVLRTLLEAPVAVPGMTAAPGLVEKVMATKLLAL
jgi:hypothetical protein